MCKLVLDGGNFADFTSVSNVFIDEYMPKANGEFIKIYLHLLRLVNSGSDSLMRNLSTERIADRFNVLESDVIRALNYWSDQGLLSLSVNDKNELTGIKLESAILNRYFVKGIVRVDSKKNLHADMNTTENMDMLAKVSGETTSSPVPENKGIVIPVKKKYSAKEIKSFAEDEKINDLIMCTEAYWGEQLGKTLNTSDINSILYMLDGLGFEPDFIQYLLETCIGAGHKSMPPIEKQAVAYARKGISSIEDAKTEQKLRRDIFKKIYKIFGSAPKAPVKKEIDFVTKWTDTYGFSDEIILEACNRTMEHTHTDSFPYTDSILSNWYQCNAKSLEAIKQLDQAHSAQVKNMYAPKGASVRPARPKNAHAFKEREYDYNNLENQLRSNQNKRIRQLLSKQDDGNSED
ncbi:MAG: DnaD domain protein [Eubacterium sp.]